MERGYYQNSIENFLAEESDLILGQLSRKHQHDLIDLQKNAWIKQVEYLKSILPGIQGRIYFEFSIPRMGKRVDNLLIINDVIFVIEFKIGNSSYSRDAQLQTLDYCLDLLNFHEGSHDKIVIPILVATSAPTVLPNQYC